MLTLRTTSRIARTLSPTCRGAVRGRRLERQMATKKPEMKIKTEVKTRSMTSLSDSFLSGSSINYTEAMYALWQKDPSLVHKSWDVYFRSGTFQPPPVATLSPDYAPRTGPSPTTPLSLTFQGISAPTPSKPFSEHLSKVVKIVRAYQVIGWKYAQLDPLKLKVPEKDPAILKPETYGITPEELEHVVDFSASVSPLRGFLDQDTGKVKMGDLIKRLREVYTGTIGYEYMHIPDVEKCNFIREQIETLKPHQYSKQEKEMILERLTFADHFERFCATKWANSKRFGSEGAESFIPGLKAIIHKAAEEGADTIIFGMPHRGRLNVLCNVIRQPLEDLFAGFLDTERKEGFGSGDVKYHLGFSYDRVAGPKNVPIHLTLLANPSHLEAVDPVVCGKAKAKQVYKKDTDRSKVIGVLLHGDAAFGAQGVVYETLSFSQMPAYSTGGTIHMVVNNQVGFTTDPNPGLYCTDLAKAVNAPIFHVNADDPEAVSRVCELATRYRMRFKTDVVIDVVCFRKHGHNELDEPAFTQPLMVKAIRAHPPLLDIYTEKLLQEGAITKEYKDKISAKVMGILQEGYEKAKTHVPDRGQWMDSTWKGFKAPGEYSAPQQTGVKQEFLKKIGVKSSTVPEKFNVHPRLKNILKKKVDDLEKGKRIDWGTAEQLAFGSLLLEGYHVRLSGQDVERGTFSHRHAVWHDQETNKLYTPLQHLDEKQAEFTVCNSSLSEFGVLGFELGYSWEHPNALILWEAQFGDFFNGAQIIIDQFLSSGEDKWLRQSGLVMLLPHGYEGAGPEHSSARLERFLQQTNDNPHKFPSEQEESLRIQSTNWQIVNCSTPANYFHVLRRQLKREFRKPLIIMTPKVLLRLEAAVSSLEDMDEGKTFQKIYPETDKKIAENKKARRVIFCSGKVYYDLIDKRNHEKITDVAIIRIEQLAPFPFREVAEEAKKYPDAEIVWCQEEPMNMGAYSFAAPRLKTALKTVREKLHVKYVGRAPSAATSTGYPSTHKKELAAFVKEAFA